MDVTTQLENELNILKERRKLLESDLKKIDAEIKQKTRAFYILKGQRVPQYIAKNPKKKVQDATQ